jgi:hypothetical protein
VGVGKEGFFHVEVFGELVHLFDEVLDGLAGVDI